jgi:tetratricopeptide (TPR) repeat protein/DNA-binding XRE family transcriptional regulator
MSLGQRIRQLRQTRGLTQSQLGGAELSKSFISLLEKGHTQASLETIVLLARRLGTSVDALLGQSGHLPEMVGEGLLALAGEAGRSGDGEGRARLLDAARFLAVRFGLDEIKREIGLIDARAALEERRFEDAWSHAARVRGLCAAAQDFWRAGRALVVMGWVEVRRREIPAARPLLEEALLMLRRARAGRDPARVEALIALGTTLGFMGDYAGAVRRFEEAVRSDVAQHNLSYRGQALWGIAVVHRKLGQLTAAREYLLLAKDAFEAAEELKDLASVLVNLGDLRVEQRQPGEALRHFQHALRVTARLGSRVTHASTLTEIGRTHLVLGNVGEAAAAASQALAEAREVGDPVEVAEAQVVLARVSRERGEVRGAIGLYQDALAAFHARDMREKVAGVARELGLLLRERGAHAQAAEYLAISLEREPA